VSTGNPNFFLDPKNVQFFEEIMASGLGLLSSLSAGNTLLAVHLGAFWEERLYWWIPAFDTQHRKYAGGRLLLELLMKESYERGHTEFDFLIGDEPYKWQYATHVRIVQELGRIPIRLLFKRKIKAVLKVVLNWKVTQTGLSLYQGARGRTTRKILPRNET
jgi:CelD/BcsL family acetyltransferase involved in cellulose biosynthesis